MKRKKFSILILFLILTVVFVSAAFVACNNTTEEETAEALEPTEGLLISNSDFKVIGTSGSYPHTVTDWTGGKLYSSSSVPGDVIAGAISLEEATAHCGTMTAVRTRAARRSTNVSWRTDISRTPRMR